MSVGIGRRLRSWALILPLVGGAAACTPGARPGAEPVQPKKAAAAAKPASGPAVTSVAPAPAVAPPGDPNCVAFDKLPGDPPLVLPGKSIVLTRIMKPCVLAGGKHGYDRATPYLAMGFPCTGGSGRIDIKGHYNNPKMLSFILGTDCAMAPAAKDAAEQLLSQAFALPKTAKLAAYTPFVVQFWELPGMSDADVGYSLDMRSAPAVEGLWRRLQQHQAVRVRLFGRENTWVEGGSFYFVEADLRQTGRAAFQLEVATVKPLSKDEITAVKGRCEALRPKRNCTDVF